MVKDESLTMMVLKVFLYSKLFTKPEKSTEKGKNSQKWQKAEQQN